MMNKESRPLDPKQAALIDLLASDNWPADRDHAKQLVVSLGNHALYPLCLTLRNDRPEVRNRAATCLRDLGDSRAVEPILEAIGTYRGSGSIGTMVWALQTLDCSRHFDVILELAMNGVYEVHQMALRILREQRFTVDDVTLQEAIRIAKQEVQEAIGQEQLAHAMAVVDALVQVQRASKR